MFRRYDGSSMDQEKTAAFRLLRDEERKLLDTLLNHHQFDGRDELCEQLEWPFRVSGRRATYTEFTWAEGTATQGCDRSADLAAGMMGRRKAALPATFWRKSAKSQGFGDRVPNIAA